MSFACSLWMTVPNGHHLQTRPLNLLHQFGPRNRRALKDDVCLRMQSQTTMSMTPFQSPHPFNANANAKRILVTPSSRPRPFRLALAHRQHRMLTAPLTIPRQVTHLSTCRTYPSQRLACLRVQLATSMATKLRPPILAVSMPHAVATVGLRDRFSSAPNAICLHISHASERTGTVMR